MGALVDSQEQNACWLTVLKIRLNDIILSNDLLTHRCNNIIVHLQPNGIPWPWVSFILSYLFLMSQYDASNSTHCWINFVLKKKYLWKIKYLWVSIIIDQHFDIPPLNVDGCDVKPLNNNKRNTNLKSNVLIDYLIYFV